MVTPRIDDWGRHLRRSLGAFVSINFNRALGRSFVPDPRWRLFVEPVSFCNLECKFCSYPKNIRARTVMDDTLFKSCIDQAASMGFETVPLTPITGDVFLDKNFVSRLQYIDASAIKSTAFYTNFIGANADIIRDLFALRKLRFMEISVYGHDLESFRAITGRDEIQYERLLANLRALKSVYPSKPDLLEIVLSFRTYRSVDPLRAKDSELLVLADELKRLGVSVGHSSRVDNWGGAITKDDVADIEMDLTDGKRMYKRGPCALPFDSIQVTATGEVNACACRDPKGTLNIGNLNDQPLDRIISPDNDVWTHIIDEHESGRFNEVCKACGFYQSIYDPRRYPDDVELVTKDEFFRRA